MAKDTMAERVSLLVKGDRRVEISEEQIEAWRKSWPCSGLDGCIKIVAEFASNGDLVDFELAPDGADVRADGYALSSIMNDARDGKL